MRNVMIMCALCALALGSAAQAADEKVRVELNAIDSQADRCRVTLLVQNKSDTPLDTLKLDIVMFRKDGSIERRLAPDVGPLRGDKTMVRTYALKNECGNLGEVLLNDITACAPKASDACLDGLTLSSRVDGVRFYK